ncbi:hypothetical protein HC928_08655 [bacterium]|nr:hypothetical protein [bacterium]
MSPCLIKRLTHNDLEDVDYTADSLEDAAEKEPADGVYTVTNTFDGLRVLKFDEHLSRLEDSATRAGIPLRLDRIRLRRALRQMIQDSGFGRVRFRLTVPRSNPHELIISMEPFRALSAEFIARGARCITAPNSARSNPRAKTTGWMHDRKALQAAMPPGIYDTILLDADGNLLEGLASNFYTVMDERLYTAEEGILHGISRQIVFAVAPDILPIVKEPVNINDLARMSEAFITSSSRGVVPVIEIDGYRLGDGLPGVKTMAIRHAYLQWVATYLQDL